MTLTGTETCIILYLGNQANVSSATQSIAEAIYCVFRSRIHAETRFAIYNSKSCNLPQLLRRIYKRSFQMKYSRRTLLVLPLCTTVSLREVVVMHCYHLQTARKSNITR